jgi:hypothetical protein
MFCVQSNLRSGVQFGITHCAGRKLGGLGYQGALLPPEPRSSGIGRGLFVKVDRNAARARGGDLCVCQQFGGSQQLRIPAKSQE